MAPDPIQLPHLETFATAAELSSFSAAAKVLGVTQAAVSQRVQALETALNQSLFRRGGGRVLLTEAGRRLYEYAQQILELHRGARQELGRRETPRAGELSLAASSIPGDHLLPGLLSIFHEQYPHVQVRASVSDSMTVLGQVERGQVSLGMVGRKVDQPHLTFQFLARDRMLLVVPPGHACAQRKTVSVRELCRHPIILREVGSGLRHCFEMSLERSGLSVADLQVALELGSNEAIKEAVLRGVGAAILSAYSVRKELAAGQLQGLRVRELCRDREMFVVQDRRRVLPLSARQFLTLVAARPVVDYAS